MLQTFGISPASSYQIRVKKFDESCGTDRRSGTFKNVKTSQLGKSDTVNGFNQ